MLASGLVFKAYKAQLISTLTLNPFSFSSQLKDLKKAG